ncbi:MAG: hypothetical protein HYV15_06660 [Elusimicrobia bacterium]|nr:hypothetical protein [Elusimicrobiota bacterium]
MTPWICSRSWGVTNGEFWASWSVWMVWLSGGRTSVWSSVVRAFWDSAW